MSERNKNSGYMCMACGNCKRKDEHDGLFSFTCKCGDFKITGDFAAKIEFIGCRSWIPPNDDFNEPYFIRIDGKHQTIEIGKFGKKFIELSVNELNEILSGYDDDEFGHVIRACIDAYGE